MQRGVRPARARGRGRAPRPPAAEDRGVRQLAVRRAAHHRGRGRRAQASARSTSSSARTTCSRCATRTERGFQDVRARCEREPELLQQRLGLRALRADGRGGRPLFPGARRGRDRARGDRGAAVRRQPRRARNIEALYYVKQKLTTLKHATGPLLEYAGKLYGGRVPQVCQRPERILPRRLRPPGAPQPVDRHRARHGDHRDPGQPRA